MEDDFKALGDVLPQPAPGSAAALPEPEPEPDLEDLEARTARHRRVAGLEGLERFTLKTWKGDDHGLRLWSRNPNGWICIRGPHGTGKTPNLSLIHISEPTRPY